MRPIKFKAWDARNQRMCTPEVLQKEGYEGMLEDDGMITLQFTGRKLKKAGEIYEGDIIKVTDKEDCYNEKIGVVTWSNKDSCFMLDDKFLPMPLHEFTINKKLGNIYENPELLNV